MDIKEKTKQSIKKNEGYKLEPYNLTYNGVTESWQTGGWGHKILEGEEVPTTEEGWLAIFDKDFDKAWDSTEVLCETYNLPDNEEMMSILCEMIYQLGYKGVQNFKMMIKALQESDFVEAHYQMLDSRWRKQTKNRCEELAERMRDI
jgi:GH24 family phage-related lysozyme (muramidase)